MSDEGSRAKGGTALRLEPQETADSMDELFRLLANQRRRIVLRSLAESEEDAITLSQLAADVAWIEDVDDRDSVRIDLHHCQLPQLAEAGLLEYDPENRTVYYAADADLEALIERLVSLEYQ